METITLRDLTSKNWYECVKLSVREDQKGFVASNAFSIAEAHFNPEFITQAIYAEEIMVGFTMYGRDPESGKYWIIRLMVDQRYQGKGYGRATMVQVIDILSKMPGCDRIFISYEPENEVAECLYNSLGFHPTGEFTGGEKVSCLVVSPQ
jgi:diamine N-acetyltransferase